MSEIQQVVDRLARAIGRAVSIDDERLRLQYHSPHQGSLDQARIASILHRSVPAEVVEYVRSLGLHNATGAVRVPAKPEFGAHGRICVPIRHLSAMRGYLWIIDRDGSITPDELAQATGAAERIALLLHREQVAQEGERTRERELLRDLFAADQESRESAAARLAVRGGQWWTVLVARPAAPAVPLTGLTSAFDAELVALRNRPGLAGALHLVHADHVVLVVVRPVKPPGDDVRAMAAAFRDAVRSAYQRGTNRADGGEPIIVGAGDPHERGVDALASYEQALMACRVAEADAEVGDTAVWDECGIYRTLLGIEPAALRPERLDPAVRRLLAHDADGVLAATVERYLDSGARIKATAERLNLHRTTLYYRIHRTEEITGLDLPNATDRLLLHLNLKLARLLTHDPRR
ncbi:hypothetical protein DP939_22645 [Spongiactinospora rosea]|uniref:PucR C-terminal helix-turn-helix domain-containing protein n=1 Tax=Spongiactinospora rosea TaxID=2248750 RepID=A0A366LUP2_9ACTN|nr:helix-turn-helix domain-containing protein [Spongiactinospora rosea]RBQ17675.1 hypothetical protein DP939_22645 [Spongiactinospora rosea]